ncbi:MAG: hypothetical protein CMH57_07110 [Myxococcales bacterium]|nr:hypothetical protein [Myxococcales bacterium]
MSKPTVFIGAGTEVVVQAMIPTCQRILASGRWPEAVHVLMVDSDRRSQNRFREAALPESRARYVRLSIHQVREALSRHPEAFRDAWRPSWTPLLRDAPDNGASALPGLGRLMAKAARATLVHQLEEFRRQMSVTDEGPPDIFIVLNPLSGTSRGCVYELPRLARAIWPAATIHAIVTYPVGLERLDAQRRTLYSANFIEALQILERYARSQRFELFLDPQVGWEEREGQLVDNILAVDGRYGNQRLKQLDVREFQLGGGVPELMTRVADLLVGIATGDRLVDAALGRLSNATMHRSRVEVAGRRSHCHALNVTRMAIDPDAFRRALIARGVARALEAFTTTTEPPEGASGSDDPLSALTG